MPKRKRRRNRGDLHKTVDAVVEAQKFAAKLVRDVAREAARQSARAGARQVKTSPVNVAPAVADQAAPDRPRETAESAPQEPRDGAEQGPRNSLPPIGATANNGVRPGVGEMALTHGALAVAVLVFVAAFFVGDSRPHPTTPIAELDSPDPSNGGAAAADKGPRAAQPTPADSSVPTPPSTDDGQKRGDQSPSSPAGAPDKVVPITVAGIVPAPPSTPPTPVPSQPYSTAMPIVEPPACPTPPTLGTLRIENQTNRDQWLKVNGQFYGIAARTTLDLPVAVGVASVERYANDSATSIWPASASDPCRVIIAERAVCPQFSWRPAQ